MKEFKAYPNHSFPWNLFMFRDVAKVGDILIFDKGCSKMEELRAKYQRVNPKKNDGHIWKLIE
jgi:hypothetical protein